MSVARRLWPLALAGCGPGQPMQDWFLGSVFLLVIAAGAIGIFGFRKFQDQRRQARRDERRGDASPKV